MHEALQNYPIEVSVEMVRENFLKKLSQFLRHHFNRLYTLYRGMRQSVCYLVLITQ